MSISIGEKVDQKNDEDHLLLEFLRSGEFKVIISNSFNNHGKGSQNFSHAGITIGLGNQNLSSYGEEINTGNRKPSLSDSIVALESGMTMRPSHNTYMGAEITLNRNYSSGAVISTIACSGNQKPILSGSTVTLESGSGMRIRPSHNTHMGSSTPTWFPDLTFPKILRLGANNPSWFPDITFPKIEPLGANSRMGYPDFNQ